jgi:hypothetical protein
VFLNLVGTAKLTQGREPSFVWGKAICCVLSRQMLDVKTHLLRHITLQFSRAK